MWEFFAVAVILLTVISALLYDDGRYISVLGLALLLRLVMIPIFPLLSQADVVDYVPYFQQFSATVDNDGVLLAVRRFIDFHVPYYTVLYPGHIYSVYGENGLTLIRVVNACLSLTILPILNELNKLVFKRRFRRWQAALLLFWPSYVYFSVEVGRTVPSVLFVCLSMYTFSRLLDQISIVTFTSFLAFSLSAAIIRVFYSVYIFVLVFLVYLYKVYLSDRKLLHLGSLGVISAVVYGIGIQIYPYDSLTVERINSLARSIAHGDSAYLTMTYPSSYLDLLWYVPLQGIYYQFSPFVWDLTNIGGPLTIVAFFQATFLMMILLLTAKRVNSPMVNWQSGIVLLSALAVPFILGIGVKNAGAAVRWRLPTDLLLLSIASTIVDYEYLTDDAG